MKMKNHFFSKISHVAPLTMIVCGLLVSGATAVAQTADAAGKAQPNTTTPCSNATLSGNYGFALQGVLLGPGFPIVGVVMQHYDGKGYITQVDHIVTNGMPPATAWTSGSGTYIVHPDCTGAGVINSPSNPTPVTIHFVIVKQGTEIHQVVDENAVTTVGNKVN